MPRRKVHVIYEHGHDNRPFGSASIRLLRPLSYPPIKEKFEVSFATTYEGKPTDIVILDRLWRPDVTLPLVEKLVESIHRSGAKLIYTLDDNLLELPIHQQDLLTEERSQTVRFLLSHANQVWVTTLALKERFSEYSSSIEILRNTLDERLLAPRLKSLDHPKFPKKRTVIGMMGTYTHDDDLLMILPALKEVHKRHPDRVEFQFLGAILRDETRDQLSGLSVRFLRPNAVEGEYPLFMLWFTSQIRWDIALAPLQITPFNRYKSDIKFLDYCAIGAAGVFTRTPVYEESVRDRSTGMLVDNQPESWSQAFEELLGDDELRLAISRNATQYLFSERILAYHYQDWIKALESI